MTPIQRLLPLQNAQFGSKIEVAKNMRKGMVGRNVYDLGILGANEGSINIRKGAIYVDHGPMSI